ncbi:microsomal glutathione S-transferase 2 [Aplysia californica]|uniref:Microsomal glutathione S-transferase 2 n=1 Tax=Aplysia californica TaxID=6500 RepID=A0ABM1AD53_APLCA|nr:microsomal glutathione S-transferase 2 [Aplysia californica]
MSEFPVDQFALPGALTLIGIRQYTRFLRAVGASRMKHKVTPPAIEGNPEFERTFRAQQNTLEFYPPSLGGLWIGSVFFHPVPASLLYAGYLYGRERYFHDYTEDTEKRLPGFRLSLRFLMGLLLISVLGVGHKAVRYYGDVDLLKLVQDHVPMLKF